MISFIKQDETNLCLHIRRCANAVMNAAVCEHCTLENQFFVFVVSLMTLTVTEAI
jgi:hypothetical protein